MDNLTEKINSASVGTQVAAALETMGYHAMSGVIEQAEPMITAIAALLYLGALIAALISTALGGNYRSGLWFLIGPPLFYYTIMNQEQSDGASWKFGAFEDEGHKYVSKIVDPNNAVDVPWLFKTYNEVISSVIQSVITVVTNSDVKKQMMFMTRQRIMDGILRETPLTPGLESLIRFGTMGHCGKIMNAARQLALVNRYELDKTESNAAVSLRTAGLTTTADPQAYARAITSYSQIDNLNVPLSKDPLSVQYVMQVLDGINELEEEETKFFNLWCEDYSQNQNPASGLQVTDKRDYYFNPEKQLPASVVGADRTLEKRFEYPVSCGQVWCWMGMGLYQESKSIIDKTVERNKKPGFDEVDGLVGEILQNIAVKMTPPSKTATLQEDGPRRDSGDFSRVEDASVIPIIISGILLKRKMQEDPRSKSLSQFAEHSGVDLQPLRFSADMTSGQIEKAVMLGNQHTMAQSLQYEIFKFAYSIPYVQGML
ncbi:MAG: hypothetical protein OXT67_09495, partial [Zetaproteobacteria bacterium]|nr:hypothetical protein [Zetaproteobacteria bacterium]